MRFWNLGSTFLRNEIDVYLRPLIEELKNIWVDDANIADAYTGATFRTRGVLFWNINDSRMSCCLVRAQMSFCMSILFGQDHS